MISRKIIKTRGDGLLKLNLQVIHIQNGNLFPKGNEGILLHLNNNIITPGRRARDVKVRLYSSHWRFNWGDKFGGTAEILGTNQRSY
jgi:hypothetical protein